MQSPRNLAARLGRWSARHRKTAIGGWLAFVILAFMAGGAVGTDTLTQEQSGVGESGRAAKLVDGAFPHRLDESVLIQSTKLETGDPAYRAVVEDVEQRLGAVEGVENVRGPYESGESASPVSEDGRSTLVTFEVPGDTKDLKAMDRIEATTNATSAAQRSHPDFRVEQFGAGSSEEAIMGIFEKDLQKATFGSLPVTLLLLLLAFGSLVAAGVPLLLAITSVVATLGLVGPISKLTPVDDSIMHVILLIGLAVGVDYALFYLRRVREERAAGRSKEAAIEAAAATSGHAVLVSGVTVMLAMAGMYLAGAPTFTSFAHGTIAVVAVAMLGSVTVLPALLSLLGDRTEKLRVPGLARLQRRRGGREGGIWSAVVDRVLRRPLLSAVLAGGLLVAMAIPAIGLDTGTPSTSASLPQDEPVVQTFNHLQEAFPSETNSLGLVVKAKDVTAPAVQDGITAVEREAARYPEQFPGEGLEIEVSPDRTVANVGIEIAGDGTDEKSARAVEVMREDVVPATLAKVDGVRSYVGGQTASDMDFNDTMKSNLPYVFGFVLTAAFALLLLTFRSVVVPIKAIALNLLSVAASYGVLVMVFQHGWLKSLLGFSETGPITAWIPLFLFVILFGLSMDYHVFILSRVREAYDRGMDTGDAVSYAVKRTAGVVTSAAAVMVAVFAIFGSLSFIMFKQMGVGLAVAVLIDATLIRGVLLPATMKLLGERNWWLPRSLGWLPKLGHEAEPAPAGA